MYITYVGNKVTLVIILYVTFVILDFTMKDRIIKFLTNENITATRFADEIGVQRSSISHILSGRNNPSFEFIHKILSRYKYLNAEWLIMGNGNMIKKNDPVTQNSSVLPKINQLDLFQTLETKTSSPEPAKNTQ